MGSTQLCCEHSVLRAATGKATGRTQWWCRTVLGMAEAGLTAAEEEVFDAALAAHASQLEASGDAAAAASSGSDSSSSGERPAPLPSPADLEHFAQFFPVSLAAIQARNRTGTSGRIAACDTHRRYAIAELSTRVLRGQLPSEDDLTHLRLPLAAKYGEAAKWPAAFAAWRPHGRPASSRRSWTLREWRAPLRTSASMEPSLSGAPLRNRQVS